MPLFCVYEVMFAVCTQAQRPGTISYVNAALPLHPWVETVQAPLVQTCPAPHARPQAPQWAVEVLVSVSQPLARSESQSPRLAAQVKPQAPLLHTAAEAPLGRGQALLQRPQWAGSPSTLTSQPSVALRLQSAEPALQA
jgi:hypothetical protein